MPQQFLRFVTVATITRVSITISGYDGYTINGVLEFEDGNFRSESYAIYQPETCGLIPNLPPLERLRLIRLYYETVSKYLLADGDSTMRKHYEENADYIDGAIRTGWAEVTALTEEEDEPIKLADAGKAVSKSNKKHRNGK